MKRLLLLTLILSLALTSLACNFPFPDKSGEKPEMPEYKVDASAQLEYSENGLGLMINDDKKSYSVVSIGNCTDVDVVVPSHHNGLPVVVFGELDSLNIGVFYECDFVKSITLPDTVEVIGYTAIAFCPALEEIILPSSLIDIRSLAIYSCDNLKKIKIPASVAYIQPTSFEFNASLERIEVDFRNPYYKDIDGNLYTKDGKELIKYANGKKDASFKVPVLVEIIGKRAFAGNKNVESISIPWSVKEIGENAFRECSALREVTFSDNSTCYKIGSTAFLGCSSLESIRLPDRLSRIESNTFNGCSSIEYISVGTAVTYIGRRAFEGCKALKTLEYRGQKNRWESIEKEADWYFHMGDYELVFNP